MAVSVADRRLRSATPRVSALAAVASLSALYFVDPDSNRLPLCPLHAFTGLWCPLCGATRASYQLLHGNLATALHDNALYVGALPLLAVLWWRWLHAPGSHPGGRLLPRPVFWAGVVLAVAFGILRNLAVGRGLAPAG
jgi:Protein of unknown function (DUF2752)